MKTKGCFLKGKRVLVTGADGFIGSHLVERLVQEGASVRCLVYYNSLNSWGWLEQCTPQMLAKLDVHNGDIRDPHFVREISKDIDVIFHLAALIGIPFSYHSPDLYIDTNIKGTMNILQAARQEKTKRVLVTSTSEVYGTAQYVPIDETHPLQAQSPYSATKIAADKLAESFIRTFDMPITIVRPFNTYGPRQSARAIIPTIITQLLEGKKEIHLGSLTPTRDFNYVKDVCEAFIAIANTPKTIKEQINIATQTEISIGDMARTLVAMTGRKARIVSEQVRMRPDASEVMRLVGDRSKISRLTGWQPRVTFAQGLKETLRWFSDENNRKKYKGNIYNI